VVVDVEDVYDEFSYGMKDPAAIRSFLEHAVSTWAKAPRFVVLFGDATFDPRNYLGSGDFDFVPTRLLATNLLTTSSDDWFVDFQNRAMPEIAIGRLPVRSVEEANRVVDKLAAYQESFGDWRHRAVFVSDQEDIEAFSFEEASASLQGQLPPSVTGLDLKLGLLPQSSQRAALAEAFNTGHLLVNYIGHGSTGFWTKKGVFDVNDAAALTNGDRLPIVVALNCLNGMFDDIYSESLAEALLKSAGGGAVAVLASSALTDPSGQSALAQNFYSQLFEGKTLGEALAAAKVGITDQDVRQTFFLFGDPTLRLR